MADHVLKGKTAFVSGGGKGVGFGVVRRLARAGVNVGMNYHSSEELARENFKAIVDEGVGNVILMKGDVTKPEQVAAMFAELAAKFGGIDILVNNAAMEKHLWMTEYTEAEFDAILGVNIGGYFNCTKAVIPYMKKAGGGRILNISSVHAKRPTDFDPVYSFTKSANVMLTREAALELGAYGITVNAIDLGAVTIEGKTGQPVPIRSKKGIQPYKDTTRRRHCTPDEVGELAVNLLSTGPFLNGSSVRFDGGRALV